MKKASKKELGMLSTNKHKLRPFISALMLILFIWALSLKPPTFIISMANSLSDNYYSFNKKKPDSSLLFVNIDHESVKTFGRWPWPRDIIAKNLKGLSQAKIIGLDIIFAETTEKEKDDILAETISTLPVISGVFLNGPKISSLDDEVYYSLLDSSLMQLDGASLIESKELEPPIKELLRASPFIAALNTMPDPDQRFRHYPLAFWAGDLALPNLGVQAARMALGEDLIFKNGRYFMGNKEIPTDNKGFIRLNFYKEENFPSISFASLSSEDFNPESLKDKIVIVGVSEAGVSDLRATPLGQLPGPLMHLGFVANLKDGSIPREVSGWGTGLILFLAALLWLPCLLLHSPLQRFSIYILFFVLLYCSGLFLYLKLNIWLEIFYPGLWLVLAIISGEVHLFMLSREGSQALRSAFSSYLAPEVVESLIKHPENLRLGGESRELTLLFTDLRGFTARSETMSPENMVLLLNAYFEPMTGAVFSYKGTLDKYIGDAIMAIYNAPMEDPDHAFHACLTAISMLYELEDFNKAHPDQEPLKMGIGINTGPAVVGNLGSSFRFSYTAIGDTVNVTARLESATKEVNQELKEEMEKGNKVASEYADILLGENTWEKVKDRLPCVALPPRALKGKSGYMPIYTILWKEVERSLLKEHRLR